MDAKSDRVVKMLKLMAAYISGFTVLLNFSTFLGRWNTISVGSTGAPGLEPPYIILFEHA